jgi:hypothetical protein
MSGNQSQVPILTDEELLEALQQKGFWDEVQDSPEGVSAHSHTNTAGTAEARSQQDSQATPLNITAKAIKEKERREAESNEFEALNNELTDFSRVRPQNRIEALQLAVETLQRVRMYFYDHNLEISGCLPDIVVRTQSTSIIQGGQADHHGPRSSGYSGVGGTQRRDSMSPSTGRGNRI